MTPRGSEWISQWIFGRTYRHVLVAVAREGVTSPWSPASSPDLQPKDFHQLMVQDLPMQTELLNN